ECDLQDQAVAYGRDLSRYDEGKRAVKDKYVGPLIKTVMNRCIHCTRCVRFAAEVAGVPEMGATGRGESMEIGTYVEKALTSELSGNLIDICPVGALTSRPYAFVSRPWELAKTDSVDVLDAVGTNIRIDARGGEVLRILPRVNEGVNEEWLADRGRFSFDGLKRRRLDRPWVRRDGVLKPGSWEQAFAAVAQGLAGRTLGAVVGDTVDAEAIFALKTLMDALGSPHRDCRQDGAKLDASRPDFYLFNPGLAGVEQADAVVIIGSNPRMEAPVLNARLRKRWSAGGLRIGVIGPAMDLTYPTQALGAAPTDIAAAAAFLDGAQHPLVILGRGALARPDGAGVLAAAWELARGAGALREDWHGFALLHLFGGQVAALDLDFLPAPGGHDLAGMLAGGVDAFWLLGADGFDAARIPAGAFVVYQGHHGEAAAARADVILPGAAYTEKEGTYVNTEGRVQRGRRAVAPPGEAREDWSIIRAAADALGLALPFVSLEALRGEMAAAHPAFRVLDRGPRPGCTDDAGPAPAPLSDVPFALALPNHWQVDPITRASVTMAECVATYAAPQPLLAAE
ncbi:MAG: NADH-quinone oxidoreductase subunit NuoG, partial [Rubritepida sp.]|nr:NADH-quinone oxidoreductase subunit NuoG [Rubritepida sp.]